MPVKMSYQTARSYPLKIDNLNYGDIVHGLTKELIIWRSQKNFFRSCPCQIHTRCAGFTVRVIAIHAAVNQGVKVLKVNFKPSKDVNYCETYVCNINKFSKSAKTLDNEGFEQYSMPIHYFLKDCNK